MRRLAGLLILAAGPALAQPCEGRYPVATPLPAELREAGLRNFWGRENIAPLPGEPGAFRIRYPAGSINPGNATAPVGGAGFSWTPGAPAEARCLSYRVRFSEGFDFALGGKLPGLAGGEAPRGCNPADLSRGFSARLMWRARGEGELYLYAPDRAARCGDSIGRGSFRLAAMQWAEIQQEVIVNRPGAADGVIRLWVNGRRVLERRDLVLRENGSIRVNGLLFATFFGGSDPRWASPREQWADFAAVTLWDAAQAR